MPNPSSITLTISVSGSVLGPTNYQPDFSQFSSVLFCLDTQMFQLFFGSFQV
jgi:hypothetical protein